MAVKYDYKTISQNIASVLTGELWELTKLGDLGIISKVKNVDGLPKPEMSTHQVVYRNKTLNFPKYSKSGGQITIVLIEDADSTVRKSLYEKIEAKTKDGVIKDNHMVLGDVVLKAYKNTEEVARTYTLKGSVLTSIEESLTFAEEEGAPSEITITVDFSDYEITFS
jgi:hypothetical protein